MESTKFFKNDPPEVLVLPPNILEELGINLGNIQSYANETETKSGADALTDGTIISNPDGSDVLSNNPNTVCDVESSILETAKLMKASVFLSPTFTNLKPSNVINDLQKNKIEPESLECSISSEINNTKAIEILDKPVTSCEKKDGSQNVPNNNCKDVLPKLTNKIKITSEEIVDVKKIKELITLEILDNCNLVPVPINTVIAKNTANTNSKDTVKSFKENNKKQHYDDNNENSDNMLPPNGHPTEEKKNPTLKLQKESHKGMVFEKLKEDNVSKIFKNVNIEYEIDKEININHQNQISGDNISLENNSVSKLNGMTWKGDINISNELNEKTSDLIERDCFNSDNHDDVHFMNGVNEDNKDIELLKEKSIPITDTECKCTADDSEKTVNNLPIKNSECCNDNINTKSIIPSNNGTLFKVTSVKNNSNFDSEQELAVENDLSCIENREIFNNNKVINVNKNKVKSKLCIQGVEKPGGESDNDHKGIYVKNLKTYSKSKRTKFSKALFDENKDCLKINLNIDVDINCNINNNNSIKEKTTQKFCICEDFGYLSYYDKDIDYQHIHFWEQKGAECSLDMLLSIYEENKMIEINVPETDLNEIHIVVLDETESKNNGYNICWKNSDFMLKNTKDIIKSADGLNQKAEVLQTSDDILVNSQIINPEVLPQKSNVTVSQSINDELQNVTPKPSKHKNLDQSKKRNRKRKTAEDGMDGIKVTQNLSRISSNDGRSSPKSSSNNNLDPCKKRTSKPNMAEDNKDETKALQNLSTSSTAGQSSSKSSIHLNLDQPKKKNIKSKIAEADMDVIKPLQSMSAANFSDGVNDTKILNEKDTVPNEIKLIEIHVENKPSIKFSPRKSYITNKSGKSDASTTVTVNQSEELLVDNTLLNKNKINKIDDTVINNQPSKTDLKLTMKRKRSLALSEGSTETNKKKKIESKIKCGVCNNIVESSKWDNHVINDHCFIAWEHGQEFDFNNEDLFFKLKQHLNDNGKLICTTCNKIIKRVKTFLSHVEECTAYRSSFEKSDDSINECGSDESGSQRLRSKPVICGVCKTEVKNSLWIAHMAKKHNYLAWKEGETPLDSDDEDAVYTHLNSFIADVLKIECNACSFSCKCPNDFIKHIKNCGKTNEEMIMQTKLNQDVSEDSLAKVKVETSITCGVCQTNMLSNEWLNHISKEHKYLAWKEGEPELDVADSHRVYEYLYNLSKEFGGLLCGKCGCRRKYVNSFLKHVESCDGEENSNITMDSTMNESFTSVNKTVEIAKCGVCLKEVDNKDWEFHIRRHHSYKAWKDGQTPLNLDDEEEVYNHLYTMSKKYNGLTCNSCGMTRKYVKVFLQHIESCHSPVLKDINDDNLQEESYKCGVCEEKVTAKHWKSHAMTNHYNVAWPEGQTPIDSKNPTAVEKCLKEYKQVYSKYVCNVCGISRVSAIGFYAHVVQCGKTEEEIDPHRDMCDICNNKYLIIYKNQHISMHRDQEYAKQRKLNLEVEEKKQIMKKAEIQPERRLAAERARNVIEKYKKYKHNCSTCDFGADSEDDVKNHTCKKKKYNFSDSEDSIQLSSEQESDDTEVNSDLSNEEQEEIQKSAPSKKKKNADPNPAAAFFPFSVEDPKLYLNESAEDFRNYHLTSNTLYPQWRTCKYEVVPDELLSNYLPTLDESCKVQLHKGDWVTVKKLEGVSDKKWASAVFTGGCIQCVSWSPAHQHDAHDALGHYLSVAAHSGPDAPRLHAHTLYAHHGMLQIWDFGDLSESPKFALGIAHDFGTIWSKDWCPSGARDMLSDSDRKSPKRLGLLAVACSNGSAYILSVPYPSTITEGEKKVYKLTPVAELRMTRGNRQRFQATAINWPAQKGHSTIIVGYSDGTTALYNLDCDSPILTDTEDDMKIFYPFQDERTHNSCVTAVSSCPGAAGSSSATGGSRAGLRAAGRGGRPTRSAVTATTACFMPHWPDLLLAGNDAIVYQAPNVVSWCGGGRRLGSQQAVCGCVHSGRVAIAAPPALRIVNAHPVHKHLHKITVALLQMKPLVNKKTKQKNDDLGMKLEPSTYEDAIKKYGVELKLIERFDKSYLQQSNKPRDHYPERFPLSDVSSMAFNTSPNQHKKLAVAIHSGLIFVITV